MVPITGGCLCGAVRWRASEAPRGARACWCRLCQYLGAGSATVNVIFAADAVTIEGPLARYESIADSGNHMTRTFCPTCGTPVTSASAENAGRIVLRAGTLDDAGHVAPEATFWTSEAPDWAVIDAKLLHIERQPSPLA